MSKAHRAVLAVDAAVNLILGVLLLLFPTGLVELLGMPPASPTFYASILGAVIFGIGIALAVQLRGAPHGASGLGLAGAIAINLCGGGALVAWLLFGHLAIPARGVVILWSVAVLVLGIGVVELASGSWKRDPDGK